MPRIVHTPEPCSYNKEASAELLANEDFTTAFEASFRLLGTLFVFSPKTEEFQSAFAALQAMGGLENWPFGTEEELAEASKLLARATAEESQKDQVVAYTRLFRGPGHLYAPPWGSVYMDRDQVMYGWTWVNLRTWMRERGYAGLYEENDPEDQLGRLLLLACEIVKTKPEALCEFLGDHVLCWSGRYLELLAEHAESPTYDLLAVLTQATLADVQDLLGIRCGLRKLYR